MKKNKNREFVKALYLQIPESKLLTSYLADILDLNKESVYRRLRSEVPFTYEEICTISTHLNISLDRINGLSKENNSFFDLHVHKSDNPIDIYMEIMEMNINILNKVGNTENVKVELALNRLPFAYGLLYKTLSKLYYYKWFFHTQNVPKDFNFSDFHLPLRIEKIYEKYIEENKNLNCEMDILIDNTIFLSIIKDINYFVSRELIDGESLMKLQQDLLLVIDYIEGVAKKGYGMGGSPVNLYLSSVDLEPCYLYVKYEDKANVYYWTPSGEVMNTSSPKICSIHENWIQSSKRYTTLITKCNVSESNEYFEKQRHYVKSKLVLRQSDQMGSWSDEEYLTPFI